MTTYGVQTVCRTECLADRFGDIDHALLEAFTFVTTRDGEKSQMPTLVFEGQMSSGCELTVVIIEDEHVLLSGNCRQQRFVDVVIDELSDLE